MTIEAAVVLPCFLFFFINLSSSLEMIRLHGNLEYALHNAGNEVCLYGSLLTDEMRNLGKTGHVSAAETDKIFERFYRGDKARNNKVKNGYGLGLAIAKSIMEIHKIKIQVTCEQNAWIRFLMTM